MHSQKRKSGKLVGLLKIISLGFLFLIVGFIAYYSLVVPISPPEIESPEATLLLQRENPAENYYTIGNNWLRKNGNGLWEMYVEGTPFEIGFISGKLSEELILIQEEAFVEQINELIPSKFYLRFLNYLIGWFNRDLDKHIIDEYKEEIYGVSLSASSEFNYISDNYERMLNYHAAHDIGHALKDLALVGCTSFAVNLNGDDRKLLIGRNFDFFVNEKFAENKIVSFVNPSSGYKFMYITWASMIGVVSGMNEHGLTVTINAAKSDIPTKSATPISILAREILQYAKSFEEAKAIAENRKVFVSESILIGSANEKSAMIIEKSPSKIGFFTPGSENLVCSNHFQSNVYKTDENNLLNIESSASKYREERCTQLIQERDSLDYLEVAAILRDHKGMNNANIGIGNEKAMAQMISHHSVIFQPEKLMVWVSTNPYQLGKYIAYDLKKIFSVGSKFGTLGNLNQIDLTIPPDPFLDTREYLAYLRYKELEKRIEKHISLEYRMDNEEKVIDEMILSNPEYYKAYMNAGEYYFSLNKMAKAKIFFNIALSKELENTDEKQLMDKKLEQIKKQAHN